MSGTGDDPMLLAAEYALGTLDLADMRAAESMMARDPAFADEVARWEARLDPLLAAIPPLQPPPAIWSRLVLATGTGVDVGRATVAKRSGSGAWRIATGASLAVAAGLALFAFLPRPPVPGVEPARFAAALSPIGQPARYIAVSQPDGSLSIVDVGTVPASPGRSFELWALPAGATAPVSLGVLQPGQRLVASPAVRPSAQEQLLVSDEPSGGSKTGAPTGPVVFGGQLVPLSPAATPGR